MENKLSFLGSRLFCNAEKDNIYRERKQLVGKKNS